MSKESLEELRERLIRDERVRQMIRVRAYEIYQMRGHHAGSQAQDWFQAEEEVVAFLMAGESSAAEEKEPRQSETPPTPKSPGKKAGSRRAAPAKPADSKVPGKKRTASKRKPSESKPKRTTRQSKPENTN